MTTKLGLWYLQNLEASDSAGMQDNWYEKVIRFYSMMALHKEYDQISQEDFGEDRRRTARTRKPKLARKVLLPNNPQYILYGPASSATHTSDSQD
ncbi:hypothetical protein MMC20_001824 [Loxospora ochrophaea]|nr:hypothetical protein [Loxospora ochrophaea]